MQKLTHEEYQSVLVKQKEALDEYLIDPLDSGRELKYQLVLRAISLLVIQRGIECPDCTLDKNSLH